uniref:Cilia- and flagella-associated protein 206 n=1 Tax=Hucho hucho TaxID=62062 RepID=A0A4W5MTZ7_9TELE
MVCPWLTILQAVSVTVFSFFFESMFFLFCKNVVLDPQNIFKVDRTLTQQDLCVDKLMDQGSPALDTIKKQAYFDMKYKSRREFLEDHQRVLQSKLGPVSREIPDSRVKTREDLEGLYHKIVSNVLLSSGLVSPTDTTAVRELELGTFLSLIKKVTEQQLNKLSMIVTGLFNKDSRKGGEGIDGLPAILNERLLDLKAETKELYNIRQHEAFLKVNLVSCMGMGFMRSSHCIQLSPECFFKSILFHKDSLPLLLLQFLTRQMSKQVESLQTELATRNKLLMVTVLSETNIFGYIAVQIIHFPPLLLKIFKKSDLCFFMQPKHRSPETYYVFSSKEAPLRFGSKPDEYIARVAEKTKRSPELIQLLQLSVSLHILRELRRKAIKLVNSLHSKVAHSMQANLIHMRRYNVTQTYLPKDGACQCKKDGKSNVPKPQVFLAGLLGGKTNTTHMIKKTNLTRSVH